MSRTIINHLAISATDNRNRYRVGKCGKYQRSPESIERQKAKLAAYWADPKNRRRQSEITKAGMSRPGVSERIAAATAAALADPETKKRQIDGLTGAFADPALRKKVSINTKRGMPRWRAERLEAAAIVLRQIPKAERDEAMAALAKAAHRGQNQ